MTLEKHLELLDLGTCDYAYLKSLQLAKNEQRARGEIPDTLICAEVFPEIEFGSTDFRNLFSKEGMKTINDTYNLAALNIDSNKVTPELIHFLNNEKFKGFSYSIAPRGGGSSVVREGQFIYFPVMARPLDEDPLTYIRRIMDVMEEVSSHYLGRENVHLASTGMSQTHGGEAFDIAHKGTDKLYKIGGKAIKLPIATTSDGKAIRLVNGGFVFHAKRDSIVGFNLIDPCGIPLEEVGVTSFEHVTGKDIDKTEFTGLVYSASKEHFYKPIPKQN